MAFEKRYAAIIARNFTSNGTANGTVELATTSKFKVKQHIAITATGEPSLQLEVKSVLSPTILRVGPRGGSINAFTNLTAYTVAKNSAILADEQPRAGISNQEIIRAVYDEEPTMALRSVMVDEYGNYYTSENPLKVQLSDGSVNIGTVNAQVEVQLTDKESSPGANDYDITRLGDGINEAKITKAKTGTNTGLNTNSINDLFSKPFTKLTVLTKNDDGDPLTIRSAYLGTPVQLMTIVYDADGDFQDAEVVDL